MQLAPRSLTNRLVATAVLLVAVVGLLVAAATTFAMNRYLTGQLDQKLRHSVERAALPAPGRGDHRDGDGDEPMPGGRLFGQEPGTIVLIIHDSSIVDGGIISDNRYIRSLPANATHELAEVPADRRIHSTDIGRAHYRVIAVTDVTGSRVVVGLPTDSIKHATNSLIMWSLALTALGVLVALLLGNLLVRRQLRPLREVATAAHDVSSLQLSTGTPDISTRVPQRLTDPATEVGQVGHALNTLLDHVDSALADRHRSEQQVRRFVADASHELRTPLATIDGYAQLARRTPDDAAALSAGMGKVKTEADRMSGLVEDLLLLARLDSGRPLAHEEVDITRLLLEAVSDARVVSPDHVWRLELPDEPITISGDEQRLHQVVTNLLNNARNHTPADTTVQMSAHVEGPDVVLQVHDDGPGIPADLQAEVFTRFTRGDSARTRSSGGAGLGLSLVEAITQAHGGRVAVTSQPGNTSFTITIPVDRRTDGY